MAGPSPGCICSAALGSPHRDSAGRVRAPSQCVHPSSLCGHVACGKACASCSRSFRPSRAHTTAFSRFHAHRRLVACFLQLSAADAVLRPWKVAGRLCMKSDGVQHAPKTSAPIESSATMEVLAVPITVSALKIREKAVPRCHAVSPNPKMRSTECSQTELVVLSTCMKSTHATSGRSSLGSQPSESPDCENFL